MTHLTSRTGNLSPFNSRGKIGKCIPCGGFTGTPIYVITSYVGSSAKFFEIGSIGLYPFSKEVGIGRPAHGSGMANVKELS
jgi:hypothetical protein